MNISVVCCPHLKLLDFQTRQSQQQAYHRILDNVASIRLLFPLRSQPTEQFRTMIPTMLKHNLYLQYVLSLTLFQRVLCKYTHFQNKAK